MDRKAVFRHVAVQRENADSGCLRFLERMAKGGMNRPIRLEARNAPHLDDEHRVRIIALGNGADQTVEVFHAPLCRRVGKAGDALLLQGHALDFRKGAPAVGLKIKIKSGIAVGTFGTYQPRRNAQAAAGQPFSEYPVGRLRIHVDKAAPLPYGDQVAGRFAPGCAGHLHQHPGAGEQQFPATARILYMARHRIAVQPDIGDKAVGPVEEYGGPDVFISHTFFRSCDCFVLL